MLTLPQIQTAPEDRVATAVVSVMFGPVATKLMAIAIMVSTFGCCNGMIMSGARVYFTMARDDLFFRRAGTLDPVHRTPVFALAIQCVWTILLTLSGQYNDLLDYVIFAVLLFYILTIGGLFRLRRTRPGSGSSLPSRGLPGAPCPVYAGGRRHRNLVADEQARVHCTRVDSGIAGGSRLLSLAKERG